MNGAIEDVLEHFVYLPKKSTINPQDVPFFLSSRLAPMASVMGHSNDGSKVAVETDGDTEPGQPNAESDVVDPVRLLTQYENRAAELAAKFEGAISRF
eukprot:CAMPEP_0171300314 /NCGR_PEP_ID=MMETSP0816-20121228/9088_1 /TAXON_ID=420281 /ORGANISM="Proboscia inermis, Strain CCAP1064/1" /LENGTH=97 /DNA_ID=CAMNT_0011776697 /DNA_START=87 /DNA_END=380 /DNA_ORIENTATION=-